MGDALSVAALVRLVVSLAILVGALWAVRWWHQRPAGGGRRGPITVIARHSLGRSSTVQVIDVGRRRFLVGTSDHTVTLLSELDAEEDLDGPIDGTAPTGAPAGGPAAAGAAIDGPDGSGLVTRHRPRIGPMDWLRTITVRRPQRVRVISGRGG